MGGPWEDFQGSSESGPWNEFATETPAPSTPQGRGIIDRVADAINQRKQNISQTWSPKPNEGVMESFTRGPQRYFNTAGDIAGGINDVAVEGAKSLYNTFVPTNVQSAISGYGQDFVNTGLGKMGVRAMQSGVHQWEQFKRLYPDAAKAVESSANISFAAPVTKAATPLITAPVKTARNVAGGVGRTAKEIIGATTGTGPGAVEEALKGGESFRRALKDQITGDEVVENAKSALGKIVEKRGNEYVGKLDKIKSDPTKLANVKSGLDDTVNDLLTPDKFDIKIVPGRSGRAELDFSKSTIVEHQPVVKKAIEDVMTWNDNTAKGLDILKKRLGTYIDQTGRSTPARSMLTQMQKTLSEGMKKEIPGYADMTRKYYEATQLIKDIESGLMMKEQGLSGRVTADQTLRRLTSAMRENFELRRELVNVLGEKGGADIAGQIAGYAMNQAIPRGLLGKWAAGSGVIYLNPKFWPLLAASSPRVMGEFLSAMGIAKNKVKGMVGTANELKSYFTKEK